MLLMSLTFIYFIISCIQHLMWKATAVLFHLNIHAWWVWQTKSIKGILKNWCFELFILSFPNLMSHSIYFLKKVERSLDYSPWMGKISSMKGIVNSVGKSVTKANDRREKPNQIKLETPRIFTSEVSVLDYHERTGFYLCWCLHINVFWKILL